MPSRKRQPSRSDAASLPDAAEPRDQGQAGEPRVEREEHEGARPVQRQPVKATLPGEMYQRAGRWWWRVKLPGEDRPRARALKPPGAKAATRDPDEAQKRAVELWEQALREEACKHITLECAEKVDRLKARFLDKVHALTEIVRGANAKAEAEAKARAEVEARLEAMIRAAEDKTAVQPPEQECRMARTDTNEQGPTQMEALVEASQGPCVPTSVVGNQDPPQTGTCECCGAEDVPAADLESIDSGQLLCPDCLAALHIDVSRIESKDLTDGRA